MIVLSIDHYNSKCIFKSCIWTHNLLLVQLYIVNHFKIEYHVVGDTWWQPMLSYVNFKNMF